jgi:hypothetical protein
LAEPLLKRIWDFSVYVFPSGKKIFYRNLVDGKFQYRGTIFSNWKNPELELLSFYNSVKASNWTIYRERLEEIILHYSRFPNDVGYSVDGFVYQVESDLRIHPLCEVNYRRTMGRIAFELAELYSGEAQWLGMFLVKPRPVPAWTLLKERLDVFALSPGDTRFEVILIKAENEREARNKIQELNELLPHSQAAIDF